MGSDVGSDMGSDGQQQGLKTLRTVQVAEIDLGHGAFKACTHRLVIMGAIP